LKDIFDGLATDTHFGMPVVMHEQPNKQKRPDCDTNLMRGELRSPPCSS
jgi:hypothetical protein